MKEIIRVERKRILSLRNFLIFCAIILVFSIVSSLNSLKNYNIYDSSRNILINSRDNLKESKLDKHITVLDEKTIKDVVDRKDTSKYLYNSNLVTLIASNYEKKVEELTDDDISNFYNNRILNIKENLYEIGMFYNADKLATKGEDLNTPLKLGYSEGWKNLNNDMIDFVTISIFIIPFIILPLFAQDPKTEMKQLYLTTKLGKKTLVKARIIAGFEVAFLIYGTALLIFSLSKLLVFGFKGANLPIQSSVDYFLCPYNITFVQQYFLNTLIGFMAVMVMVSLTLLFTVIIDQILSAAALIIFFLGIMLTLPSNNYSLNHYFKNFLPYDMTNFNNYYINSHIYSILDKIIPAATIIILVSFIIYAIFTTCTVTISNIKLCSKLKYNDKLYYCLKNIGNHKE